MMLDYVKANSDEPRLERKYYITNHQNFVLRPYINLASSGLREIYFQRKINNIYFDTNNLTFYKDNLVGAKDRIKLRLRWYGNQSMSKPNLEIKMKEANLVYKLVTPFNDRLSLPIKELLKRLRPSITNSYYRRYFLTSNKKVRLTVDTRISFNKIKSLKTVIELKYSPEDEIQASRLINQFPLFLQKNSKYVDGIASNLYLQGETLRVS